MRITGGLVFDPSGSFVKRDVTVSNGRFSDREEQGLVIDATDMYVVPGLIDIHLHGCDGYDVCDATKEALHGMAAYELKCGITSICPTTMTMGVDRLKEVVDNAGTFTSDDKESHIIGINMEGPFLSEEKMGAQNPAYLLRPDFGLFVDLLECAKGRIVLCDIAPELPGAIDFIKEASKTCRVSLAHTMADYDKSIEAFDAGADHVTHLYNGMMPYNHREPGLVGAASDREDVFVELIADGIHVSPTVVRNTIKIFGEDRVVFISDSMRACGLPDGESELGGQKVIKKGNRATLEDGTIAGSVMNLMDIVRTAASSMNIPLEAAIKCATVNPAKSLGLYGELGSIDIGKRADLLILDRELQLINVIKNGEIIIPGC